MLLRLITHSATFHNFKSSKILRGPSILRQNIRKFVSGNSATKKSGKLLINRPLTLTLGIGSSFLLKNHFSVVKCEINRTTELRIAGNDNAKFDWKRFWMYLKRHLLKLLGAVAAALAVAYLNINIPSLLGELINALSKYAGSQIMNSTDFLQVYLRLSCFKVKFMDVIAIFRTAKNQQLNFSALTSLNLSLLSSISSCCRKSANKLRVKFDVIYLKKFSSRTSNSLTQIALENL